MTISFAGLHVEILKLWKVGIEPQVFEFFLSLAQHLVEILVVLPVFVGEADHQLEEVRFGNVREVGRSQDLVPTFSWVLEGTMIEPDCSWVVRVLDH